MVERSIISPPQEFLDQITKRIKTADEKKMMDARVIVYEYNDLAGQRLAVESVRFLRASGIIEYTDNRFKIAEAVQSVSNDGGALKRT